VIVAARKPYPQTTAVIARSEATKQSTARLTLPISVGQQSLMDGLLRLTLAMTIFLAPNAPTGL
jgi:hypothetical protein